MYTLGCCAPPVNTGWLCYTRHVLEAGKLPAELLAQLLSRLPTDPRLIVGPGVGLDAAAIDIGNGRVLVASSDPVTFATEQIGRYVVHVNANDVACLGAKPMWFLATALLPEGTPPSLAEEIFRQVTVTCKSLGIVPIGGHTEITVGLDRPIVSGTMLGEVSREELVRPDGAQPGDHVLLTKAIAIEGTAILARDSAEMLRSQGVAEETIATAARLIDEPGISVVRDALVACGAARAGDARAVHALHDPTEGGLATALVELAEAAGLRIVLRSRDVLVLPETKAICSALGIDPLGLLASGALLIAVAPDGCDALCEEISREEIDVTCIGHLASGGEHAIIADDQSVAEMPRFARDELARVLERTGEGSA